MATGCTRMSFLQLCVNVSIRFAGGFEVDRLSVEVVVNRLMDRGHEWFFLHLWRS